MPAQDNSAAPDEADTTVEATASNDASGLVTPETTPAEAAPVIEDAPAAVADAPTEEAPAVDAETPDIPAEAAAEPAEVEAVETVGVAETVELEEGPPIPPQAVFAIGLGLLALFVLYFAAEKKKMKRRLGFALTVGVTALCVWLFSAIGLEEGIELQGGVSMEIEIQPGEGKEVNAGTQQQAIDVLQKRLNERGTSDVVLAPSGETGIFLQIPGVGQETLKEIEKELEKVAKLEFSILHPNSQFMAGQVAAGGEVVPGYEALPYKQEFDDEGNERPTRYGLVKIKRDMSGKNVSGASYFYGDRGDSISVSFNSDGAKIMGPLTTENTDRPLAIILDDVILSSPVINEPFSNGCSITGDFTREEAEGLASALENPLENPIKVAYSNYISPSMGAATILQGKTAGVAGLILTLLFIVIYYRFAGFLALVGMIINIIIIFGTMALFQFSLTLPGIAGIILTIGVAIDANVLIFERLREEMEAGKSLGAAINTAYDKAFSAIIDANITTLITAIILYAVAAGTVKGFAITLIIGIFASLFSALLVTRICFNLAADKGWITKLRFLNMVPQNTVDFLSKRKAFLFGSVALIVISLIIVPSMDPRGVELKGGDSITIQTGDDISKADVEESIADLELSSAPIVQIQTPVGAEGEFILLRAPDGSAETVLAELTKDLKIDTSTATVSSVGSAVGQSMLMSSGLALLIGMAAILIYVTLRFEFAFALGAIAALFHDLIIVAGVTTLLGQEVTLITVGAFLTIAGYSINDTIVVFDRVREGLATKRGNVKDIINYSLNKTLARTLLTSGTTLITVIVLFLFGGPGLRNFALTLIIGVMIGTYSSIFIASPIVLWWARRSGTNLRREVLDTEQSKIDAMDATA